MWVVFKKEINQFLSSLIAYIVMAVFLVVTGLFLWVFPEYSVLDYGYASLETFFAMAPWILIFLIPAIAMRSFAEERRVGTLELLLTRPITEWQIILGKYLATLALVLISIVPTLLYVLTIYQLADPRGNIDLGGILGSYLGLAFLSAAFTAIGLFASTITNNQIVAFILAMFLCFFFYVAFSSLSLLGLSNQLTYVLDQLSMDTHYLSLSKGVVDTRDVIYFFSIVSIFLLSSQLIIKRSR
jgi:ABC-2 type transport system permease protein